MSKDFPGQNRGFCFLEFYNHACAQHAKSALSSPTFQCALCPFSYCMLQIPMHVPRADGHMRFCALLLADLCNYSSSRFLRCRIGNKPLTITFAEPRRADIAADQAQEIKSVFVGGLPDTANEAKLRDIFAPLGAGPAQNRLPVPAAVL